MDLQKTQIVTLLQNAQFELPPKTDVMLYLPPVCFTGAALSRRQKQSSCKAASEQTFSWGVFTDLEEVSVRY